jgi:hypothetical protein
MAGDPEILRSKGSDTLQCCFHIPTTWSDTAKRPIFLMHFRRVHHLALNGQVKHHRRQRQNAPLELPVLIGTIEPIANHCLLTTTGFSSRRKTLFLPGHGSYGWLPVLRTRLLIWSSGLPKLWENNTTVSIAGSMGQFEVCPALLETF